MQSSLDIDAVLGKEIKIVIEKKKKKKNVVIRDLLATLHSTVYANATVTEDNNDDWLAIAADMDPFLCAYIHVLDYFFFQTRFTTRPT